MGWKETLHQRPIKRPIDTQIREAISREYHRRRQEIPIHTEFQWHAHRPEFTIRSPMISFIVHFSETMMTVDADLSLAAKMMATKQNRRDAVDFIESIAVDLGL